jgi:glucose/mannose-6-phosphate isomerase
MIPPDPMERMVAGFPEMLEEAWAARAPQEFELPDGRIRLFGGMGGSGMAGALAAERLSLRGHASLGWRHPSLPAWMGPQDRLVLLSYSGETWEALSLFEGALERKIPLRVIAAGGKLLDRCTAGRVPVFQVPGGLAPRAALPWLLAGAMRAGVPPEGREIDEAVRLLRSERDAAPGDRDPERIAGWIEDRLPIFLPATPLREVLALRWRNQMLENAKQTAFVSPLPEMVHHELMGWGWLAGRGVQACLIALPEPWPPSGPWSALLPALEEEALRAGHAFHVLPPHPAGGWAGLLADLYLGDRTSLALARRRGVAATPIPAITRMREAGRKEPNA